MHIANISAYVVPIADAGPAPRFSTPLVFVRLETQSGVVGWGEASSLTHRSKIIVAFINALGDFLIGLSAFEAPRILDIAKNDFGQQHLGMDLFAAASAIEIAAWDAVGRHHGVPVFEVLGGAVRDDIPLYANMYSKTPQSNDKLARDVLTQKERGFGAAKIYPFQAGRSLDQAIATLRHLREVVGPEFGIAVDIWRSANLDEATKICAALAPLDLLWIEDPIDPANRAGLARLRRQSAHPIVAGETLGGVQAFDDLLASGAVDWINPDVTTCGGISEFRDIASLALAHELPVSPHCFGSMTIGLAASAHAAIGVKNLEMMEYYPAIGGRLADYFANPIVPVSGTLKLPRKPGLGVAPDTKALAPFLVAP